MPDRTARRLLSAATTATLLLAVAAGCADNDPPPPMQPVAQEVGWACVNTVTGERADDDWCPEGYDDDDDDGFYPVFFPVGVFVPPVGHKMTVGSKQRPAGKIIIVRVPVSGGTNRLPAAGPPAHKPGARPAQPVRKTTPKYRNR